MITGALTLITPMLARLIPRLGSPFDGEKLAVLAAIERTLKAKGLDFHDFAAAIDGPEPLPRIVYRDGPAPPAEPFRSAPHGPGPTALGRDRERVRLLLRAPENLRLNDREFLISLLDQINSGRALSFKQSKWLADICARAGREYAL